MAKAERHLIFRLNQGLFGNLGEAYLKQIQADDSQPASNRETPLWERRKSRRS
jgi:hypothetical protein